MKLYCKVREFAMVGLKWRTDEAYMPAAMFINTDLWVSFYTYLFNKTGP